MEYDNIIRQVGEFGKYQKVFMVIVAISSIFNAMTTFALNFVFGEHAHRCKISALDDHYTSPGTVFLNTTNGIQEYNVTECQIQTNGTTTKCNDWIYDSSLFEATIISKFDVVCDEKLYRAHFLMGHYVGLLIGSILSGLLSDLWGRKPTMLVGITMLLFSMGLRPFMPYFALVSILEFFNGAGSMISYICPFIILTEMVGPKQRILANFAVYITFCVGNYILLLLAYFLRDWSVLYFAITIFVAAYMIVMFFISESPRWLLSRGRKKEALVILKKMAIFNGKILNISVDDVVVKDIHRTSFLDFVKTLIKSKKLIGRLLVICLNWFAIAMTYYGISMNVAKFSGDVFVNFAASSSAEFFGIIFCWLVTDRVGRKGLFCTAMILGGVTCICTIFTSLYADKSMLWLTTTLAMVGKFFCTITFFVIYIFTAELFPTVLRASVIGVASMTGRFGSISSAYVGELGDIIQSRFGVALPLMILGGFGLMAGLLSLTLPDTTNTCLPESIDDAKEIQVSKKNGNGTAVNECELETLTEKI
ncbi:organic cation transporter protein-like isoform X1 [Mytilus trossulus]|uniref:organic cation transporter protein-like isoform X1 n=1 Tax=Mytilus trossulus TaxID=6551 RepID=UPI0030065401